MQAGMSCTDKPQECMEQKSCDPMLPFRMERKSCKRTQEHSPRTKTYLKMIRVVNKKIDDEYGYECPENEELKMFNTSVLSMVEGMSGVFEEANQDQDSQETQVFEEPNQDQDSQI